MHRNWLVSRTNHEYIKFLSGTASISPVLAQVLINRGIKDADAAKAFLSPSLHDVHDPFLLKDMDRAVHRLKAAVEKRETVFVHGDYDADGLTSTALLVHVLRKAGLQTYYHVPNRMTEGYGISSTGIEKAAACGARLMITVDCGISAEEAVSMAGARGIDVIITDHHEPQEKLPDALAVIDPHRKDSEYPFRYLAGVGVAFKLVQAMSADPKFRIDDAVVNSLLDLVALGTIADSVPLVGENRVFVKYGVHEIGKNPCRPGLEALKNVAGLDRKYRSGMLSFTMIPRINAAGRLGDAGEVVELFLTEDETVAGKIAARLDGQNKQRQKIEGEVFKQALDMIDPHDPGNAIVLASYDWHPGVIGIVASRLVDMFYRPVFLFSLKDAVAKGSARGIPPLHLYEAISGCSDLLLGYGGHRQAAGLRLNADNMNAFRDRMNAIVGESLAKEDMVPVLEIDAAVRLADINFNLVRELSLLEPFGESNREPLFGVRDIKVTEYRIVGNNHLKMQVKQDSINMDTIGFSMGEKITKVGPTQSLDIAFVPCINEWNGSRNLQLNLKAFRPSGV